MKNTIKLILLLSLGFINNYSHGQSLVDSLQTIVEEARTNFNLAGLSAAVNFENETSWTGLSGLAGDGIPLTDQYLFPIGSATKVLVSASIMQLMEDGQLSLDDSLGTWLASHPQIDGAITIKQLLNHTSGIYNFTSHPNFFTDVESDYTQIFTPSDLLINYVDAPYFSAGSNWSYSNTNYLLLGFIIEAITGLDCHDAIRTKILNPLQLNDIGIFPFEPFNLPLAHLFQGQGASSPSVDLFNNGVQMDTYLSSAWMAGAYTARSEDLAFLFKRIYDGTILQQTSIDLLSDELFYMGGNIDYGLGTMFFEIWPETTLMGHGGDIFYTTQSYYDPIMDISFTINANDTNIFAGQLLDIILQMREAIKYFDSLEKSRLYLTIFLEGNYDISSGTMHNMSFIQGLIPNQQPYDIAPWDCFNNSISTNAPSTTVDWVLVEAMTGTPNVSGTPGLTRVESQVALLQSDGSLFSPDGMSGVEFSNLIYGEEYYFIVRHRNHLDVLTANSITAAAAMNYDFSINSNQAFGLDQVKLMDDGKYVLYAGDYSPDGVIQNTDYDQWKSNPAIINTYNISDGNLDGSVQTTDFDQWITNKAKIGVLEVRY